jgi:O-antigen ligase
MKALNIKRGSTGWQGLLLAIAAIIILCSNSGCATIQRHPVLTAVAVGLVAGSIAVSASGPNASRQMPAFHSSCGRQCP